MTCRIRAAAVLALAAWAPAALPQTPARKAAAPRPGATLAIPVTVPVEGGEPRTIVVSAPVGARTPVGALAFSPDGKLLASGGRGEVLLWDLATGALRTRFGGGTAAGQVLAVAFYDKGASLAVGEGVPGERGAVRIYDIAGKLAATLGPCSDQVTCVAVSPDDQLVAAGSADGAASVWSLADRKQVAVLKGHGGAVRCLAFSKDGKLLATGGDDRTARVWQRSDWREVSVLQQSDSVQGLAFNQDAQYLLLAVGGDADRGVRFRHWPGGWQAFAVDTAGGKPLGLLWDHATNRAIVPCADGTARIVATDRWPHAVIATLEGHGDWVVSAALTADGKRMASGSADGTVRLWSMVNGTPLATLAQLAPNADRWLVVTAHGYVAASAPASLTWKAAGLKSTSTKIREVAMNAEGVALALSGLSGPAPTFEWTEPGGKR